MTTEKDKLSGWAIVEIMGHQKFVGEISTQDFGGTSMLRVDIPASNEHAAFTKMFGFGSVYCITPIMEDIGRALASQYRTAPFSTYDLPEEWRQALRAHRKLAIACEPGSYDDKNVAEDEYYDSDDD